MSHKNPVPTRRKQAIQKALLKWYQANHRNLPWREDPQPYHVWVAEIMAQQTRLDTVGPYYKAFLKRFPDPACLAEAPLDAVLAAWSGLGYYRRARHLHQAAQVVVSQYDGRLPSDPKVLQQLPGIGRYTAGAIASVAYGVPAPILDGNVLRLLSRLFNLDTNASTAAGKHQLWSLAEALVPTDSASNFNQAMMEMGALVCTPRNPKCLDCPTRRLCHARRAGSVDERPVLPAPKRAKTQSVLAVLLRRKSNESLLMLRHPGMGLFAHMWSVPTWPPPWQMDGKAGPLPTNRQLQRKLGELLGTSLTLGPILKKLEHQLTHRRLIVTVREGVMESDEVKPEGYTAIRFVGKNENLEQLGISTLTRRILK